LPTPGSPRSSRTRLALLIGWEILCLGQVIQAERVRFLPRWVWAVASLIFIPLGGILYLAVGRVWTRNR
jgi:Phospholipase_D-nuclease N-terminal